MKIPPEKGAKPKDQINLFGLTFGFLLLLLLFFIHITQGQAGLDVATVVKAIFSPDDSAADNIVRYVRLPRASIGIIAGAALGIAGVLLQTVTRNPLSSPATLGINAGAYLAVTVTAIFVPGLFAWSPVLVAFAGGMLAAILVYAIAGLQVTPIRLTLAGVAVSLALAAFTAALQLFYENETAGLFFWGAGSLVQTNWSGTTYALPQVAIGVILAMLMAKSLDVLLLGDEVARSLGSRVQLTRLFGTLVAVFLAAVAVSVVGPISFVGLVAPHLVRLMGCRQHQLLLPGAAFWGAIILVGADIVAQALTTNLSELPAGSVTALIGAPFLIWLARSSSRTSGSTRENTAPLLPTIKSRYILLLCFLTLLLLISLVAGLLFGGISLTLPQIIDTFLGSGTALSQRVIFSLRLPRLLVAVLAGASLAASGLLLQGVVRNPLAGPEIVGITSGAGLGALLILVLLPNAPVEVVPIAAFIGAFAAFGVVYLASWQGGISPSRLALVGIAVSAFCAAGTNILVVMAKLRVAQALVWLAGSTYARDWDELWRLMAFPVILLPLSWFLVRWLDLMALGEDFPRTLGMRLQQARGISVAIAVALAAAAVSTVGTISFVGLIAPHAARLLIGHRHRQLLPVAAILGAILVTVADTVGRVALAPKEIPSGLVTAMIGTPYFLWLLIPRAKAK
ncbi:iron ABC transporter permease [Trichocoleus sp. FACHB-90]|uniref:iron ABC transporter permease n=1 Tax=Cyanophyceae TaxID=3028117 RepID=UPI001683365F|nr:iron ABC transporter permease [Trichocoleus sp. FACHB-90]MBD1925121.1 iron ABC transporter permease [Trichocoleus sp. FACHB-90]